MADKKSMKKYIRKKTLKYHNELETEEGVLPFYEVVMSKAHIKDRYNIHVGNAILQHSKLHFLRYLLYI